MAVCCMVASAVEDAGIAYRRMTMLADSESPAGISYTATLAASSDSASVKPAGTAKAIPTSESKMFGGGHVGKVQERPLRPTEVPSGQTRASIGQAIGCEGYSSAFRYTNPPTPTRMMSAMPSKRPFMWG